MANSYRPSAGTNKRTEADGRRGEGEGRVVVGPNGSGPRGSGEREGGGGRALPFAGSYSSITAPACGLIIAFRQTRAPREYRAVRTVRAITFPRMNIALFNTFLRHFRR